MTGEEIPDEHHVVRLVGGSKIDKDTVYPDAFRDACGAPSVNWLECVDGTKDQQIKRVQSLIRRKPGKTEKFAELNVGSIRGIANGLDVRKDPLPEEDGYPPSPCHAEIVNFPEDNGELKLVLEALASGIIRLHDS